MNDLQNGQKGGKLKVASYAQARLRFQLLTFVAWPVGAVAIMALAFELGDWYAILALIWTVLISFVTQRIMCPDCGRSIGFAKTRLMGIPVEWWTAFPPRACQFESDVRIGAVMSMSNAQRSRTSTRSA